MDRPIDREAVLAQVLGALGRVPALKGARTRVERLGAREEGALYVAIVGITSSGKSTFINALMGEELLPEEARATTNLLVRCRKGPRRRLTVVTAHGRHTIQARRLTPAAVARLCSERHNPGNQQGIECLEWESPTAALPDGVVLFDTPGLDAHGFPGHEELTLREILPRADIVVFMTSVRNPLKQADYELARAILANDQRVLFVLSQKDLEVDSHVGGVLLTSREAKIHKHLQRLRVDIERFAGLRSFGAVAVSSLLAKQARGDRTSKLWAESGFDAVATTFDAFALDLDALAEESGAHRLAVAVDQTVGDVTAVLERSSAPTALARQAREAKDARDALAAANRRLIDLGAALDVAVAAQLDPAPWLVSVRRRFGSVRSSDAVTFLSRVAEIQQEWGRVFGGFTKLLDDARSAATESLRQVGLTPERRRANRQDPLLVDGPDAAAFVQGVPVRRKIHGWRWGWPPWPQHRWEIIDLVDVPRYLQAAEEQIRAQCAALAAHHRWWRDRLDATHAEPVREALHTAEQRRSDLVDLVRAAEQERSTLQAVREDLVAAREALGFHLDALRRNRREVRPITDDAEQVGPGPCTPDAAPASFSTEAEQTFVETFLGAIPGLTACEPEPTILVLGACRDALVRLAALLAHRLEDVSILEQLSPRTWFEIGGEPVVASIRTPPARVHRMASPDPAIEGVRVIVAAPDSALPDLGWDEVFRCVAAIGVLLDAPRIGSGLQDVARAPYGRHLQRWRRRLFLCSGDGALFRGRLSRIVTDVVEAAKDAPFGRRTARQAGEAVPWFVYEDFDARYTRLVELLARRSGARGSTDRELARAWTVEGLSFAPPFTERALRQIAAEIDVHTLTRRRSP